MKIKNFQIIARIIVVIGAIIFFVYNGLQLNEEVKQHREEQKRNKHLEQQNCVL